MLDIINSRRSVRKFTTQPVSDQDVNEILETAMNAPSAHNEQAWQFIVLTDEKVKSEYASFNQNAAYVKNAPVAILVCGDLNAQQFEGYYVQDCSAAVQNILLAIHSKGLGGVWCTVFPDAIEKVKELFNLPENIVPFAIVPFGYADKLPAYKSRFDVTRVHHNKW